MLSDGKLWMAKADNRVYMEPRMCNRHGFIAGASGTGKTITLKVMAEAFSDLGVPVFLADIKGDLAGMCVPGVDGESMQKRIARFGIENWQYKSFPTRFWDIYGEYGHPVRTTVSEMGPLLLSRLMELTQIQNDVLNLVFRIADDKGLLLIDIKDLRAMVRHIADNRQEYLSEYGNMSPQTLGAIQRALLTLEDLGGDVFFGEPSIDIFDWIRTDGDGRGYINVLHSVKLVQNPTLYATFMLFLMSELFEKLEEAGDPEKPRIVFFFDEAHLLFDEAPKVLLKKIEQVVKLIRSKGVGIYFISQHPGDVPDEVLAQLSNRVQHALRAYTPAEQKAVRTAAATFRPNPAFRTEDVITEMGVGEALVSFLDAKGVPGYVERAFILPPQSRMGVITDEERAATMAKSDLAMKYGRTADRESAYEYFEKEKAEASTAAAVEAGEAESEADIADAPGEAAPPSTGSKVKAERAAIKEKPDAKAEAADDAKETAPAKKTAKKKTGKAGKAISKATSSAMNTIGREVGKKIVRGLFGSIGNWL